jgi:penicillin V acylase-like amidase (Ntn superfamily)
MKRLTITTLLIIVFYQGFSCTSFILREKNNYYLAKNFDYFIGDGLIFINQRNDIKIGPCIPPEKPSQWISKYGSITFNLYGKDLPMSGMNEKGLTIECLWLEGTKYPIPDNRLAVPELGWIQFMLDNCSTIDEVIEFDKQIRISNTSLAGIHFIMIDSLGNSAIFEMIDGKTLITKGKEFQPEVIENQIYSESLKYMKNFQLGQRCYTRPINDKRERFEMVSEMLEDKLLSDNSIDYSFRILKKVSWTTENGDSPTQWSIIYDINSKTIHFLTKNFANIKTIKLSDYNFDCSDDILTRDINLDLNSINVKDFKKYNIGEAKIHMKNVFEAGAFTRGKIPDDKIDAILNATSKKGCIK